MIKNLVKGKVYIFIDGENVFYSQRTLGWRISYHKLMKYFHNECGKSTKCFIYTGLDEDNTKQKKFIDMLDLTGYITRTKVIKKIRRKDGSYQWKNNLDIELALEMVEFKDKFDTAILVSGDSDFAVVLDKLKQAKKRVLVMSTRGHVARELLERAKFIDLRKLKGIISQ